jgi:hypothetical protein
MQKMEDQPLVYIKDVFGLRSMKERNTLFIDFVPGVYHTDWLERDDLFKKYIEPHLD